MNDELDVVKSAEMLNNNSSKIAVSDDKFSGKIDDFMSLLYNLWYYRLMPAMVETPKKSEEKSIEELIKEIYSYRYEPKEDNKNECI